MALLPTLRVAEGALPAGVLLPGDPARALRIAQKLEGPEELGKNREFHSYRGLWQGVPVGVVSTGVGAPGAALCAEEALRAGAKILIRVGTAGSLQEHVRDGHLVVALGAVRAEGTTPRLLPLEFPALADPEVAQALFREAQRCGAPVHRGVVVTLDAFYQGVLDLGLDLYARSGALAVEMECSAIFCVAQLRGARAGAILAIDGEARRAAQGHYNPHREVVHRAVDLEIEIALNALVHLLQAHFGERGCP
ncbi:MAG: nucleoside phosphorylase [Candidatus Bipolaricaulota bacterium]|nr:nucleoside phosphorylase [Candidatus Bipolaricaulota bacterium]MCX7844557.1 nucleoside phosphorylase [Candidatus Bipolaricaulota bacterium]MDW8152442.1 nucleoside phosphorylase [Candidatus Bipolaricaulota bacterium]